MVAGMLPHYITAHRIGCKYAAHESNVQDRMKCQAALSDEAQNAAWFCNGYSEQHVCAQVACVLLPLCFLYDVFWVFLQPLLIGGPSVMVQARPRRTLPLHGPYYRPFLMC